MFLDKRSIDRSWHGVNVNATERIICCTAGSWTSFSFSHLIAPGCDGNEVITNVHTRVDARKGELFVFVALLGRPVNN